MLDLKQLYTEHYIDPCMIKQYLEYIALEKVQRKTFSKVTQSNGHSYAGEVSRETAFENRTNVWHRLNPTSNTQKQGKVEDVVEIRNVGYEHECPEYPEFSVEVERRLRLLLSTKTIPQTFSTGEGIIPKDLPLIHSGAGIHTIINIQPIEIKSKKEAHMWNDAVEKAINEYIRPTLLKVQDQVNDEWGTYYELSFTTFHIAQLVSAPGDWRFSTKKNDNDGLKDGVLRTVISGSLKRNEWRPMLLLIQQAFGEIQERTERTFKLQHFSFDLMAELVVRSRFPFVSDKDKKTCMQIFEGEIDQRVPYLLSFKKYDKSRLFYAITDHMLKEIAACGIRNFSEIVFSLAYHINEKTGGKYQGVRVEEEIERVIRKREHLYYIEEQEIEHKTSKRMISCKEGQEAFFSHFFAHCTNTEQGHDVEKDLFIQHYVDFCKDHQQKPLSERLITRLMKKKGIDVKQVMRSGKRFRVYSGIVLSEKLSLTLVA